MQTLETFEAIVRHCNVDGYRIFVRFHENRIYLQAEYNELDIDGAADAAPVPQRTRKWLLSWHMTRSEVVQTAFKCVLTSAEHRMREAFTYKGRRIFGPHFDVEALLAICDKLDVRDER